jgi:biofilm PGA synthesis N-glycosyltransferase PgaC
MVAEEAALVLLAAAAGLAIASLAQIWLGALWRGARARRRAALPTNEPATWPFVSVIVPAWNERATIKQCIAALRHVDYPAWETVVVAGGSDGTYEEAIRQSGRLSNCQVVEQQPLGKPAALNAGLRVTNGEIIVLLDADSLVSSQWLRALVAPLDRVIGAATGNPLPTRLTAISRTELMERIVVYEIRREPILQGSGSIAIARDLIAEIGPFPEDAYADDWDLDARLAVRGIARGFCPGAVLRTERPATLGEYWRNEVRWRRAHLISLFQLPHYFFRDVPSTLRSLYPYVAAWLTALLTALTLLVVLVGDPELSAGALAFWGIVIAWLVLGRVALVIQVIAYTGERRWLRDVWAPPVLFLITLVAACVASLTTRRATLDFKGPRRVVEDESGL